MTKSQYAELLETSEKHSIGLLEFVAEDGEPLCTYSTVHHSVVTAESHRHHTGRSVAGGRPGRGGEGRGGEGRGGERRGGEGRGGEGRGGEGRGGEGRGGERRDGLRRTDMGGEGLHC